MGLNVSNIFLTTIPATSLLAVGNQDVDITTTVIQPIFKALLQREPYPLLSAFKLARNAMVFNGFSCASHSADSSCRPHSHTRARMTTKAALRQQRARKKRAMQMGAALKKLLEFNAELGPVLAVAASGEMPERGGGPLGGQANGYSRATAAAQAHKARTAPLNLSEPRGHRTGRSGQAAVRGGCRRPVVRARPSVPCTRVLGG